MIIVSILVCLLEYNFLKLQSIFRNIQMPFVTLDKKENHIPDPVLLICSTESMPFSFSPTLLAWLA